MNETLTESQAQEIKNQFGQLVNNAVEQIGEKFTNFFTVMEQEWEDGHTVEFASNVKQTMTNVSTHLQENSDTFVTTLESICNAYTSTGNKAAISIEKIVVGDFAIVEHVKETFEDGETFGFKNADASYSRMTNVLEELSGQLSAIIAQLASSIQACLAFGRTEIAATLGVSAGEIIKILSNAIKELKTQIDESLKSAANAYLSTGEASVTAANISAE